MSTSENIINNPPSTIDRLITDGLMIFFFIVVIAACCMGVYMKFVQDDLPNSLFSFALAAGAFILYVFLSITKRARIKPIGLKDLAEFITTIIEAIAKIFIKKP